MVISFRHSGKGWGRAHDSEFVGAHRLNNQWNLKNIDLPLARDATS
jgi:hypothetical protein